MHSPLYAFILAAGSGSRMQSSLPKQYLNLNNSPLFMHSLNAFLKVKALQKISLVIAPNDVYFPQFQQNALLQNEKIHVLKCGGKTRAKSIGNALSTISLNEDDWVLVHDAARALIEPYWIEKLIAELSSHPVGGFLAIEAADTLKKVSPEKIETVDRAAFWQAQTPQMFRYGVLKKALKEENPAVTDEASAVENLGLTPQIVRGSTQNFKITTPEDFNLATHLLKGKNMNLRIGEGFDVHPLVENRNLIIGGVSIPFHKGLNGHSDADVLLHAIIDALLGAAALGDIGQHFPDSSPQFKNAESRILLKETGNLIHNAGLTIHNIDSTVIAERPKLKDYLFSMRENIAEDLNISINQINIKAKTNEKLGYLGKNDAIEARVVALLNPI